MEDDRLRKFFTSAYKNAVEQVQATIDFVFDVGSESKLAFVLVVASISLTLGSGFTTYEGMLQYTQKFVAFVVTIGIQGLLFVISWKLGYALKNNERKFMLVIIFIICASISIFFSFSSLFDVVNTEELKRNKGKVVAINKINKMYLELNKIINESIANNAELLLKDENYKKWKKYIGFLISNINESQKKERELIKGEISEKRVKSLNLDVEINALKAEEDSVIKGIQESQNDILSFEDELSQFISQKTELLSSVKKLQKKLDIEINEGGATEKNSNPGFGPIAKSIKRELNQKNSELIEVEEQIKFINTRIIETKQRLDELKNYKTKIIFDLNTTKTKQRNINTELGNINSSNIDISIGESNGILEMVTKMESDVSIKLLEKVVEYCQEQTNLQNIRQSENNCDYSGFISIFKKVNIAKNSFFEFDKSCKLVPDSLALSKILEHGNNCIGYANKIVILDERYINQLNELNNNYNTKTHHFSLVITYFFDGDNLTLLAFFIAVSIDILVLLCGILGTKSKSFLNFNKAEELQEFGEYPLECIASASALVDEEKSDTPEIRRMKIILRNANFNIDETKYSAILDLEKLPHDMNIHIELGTWRSMGLVKELKSGSKIIGLRTKLILWMCEKIVSHKNSRKVKRSFVMDE